MKYQSRKFTCGPTSCHNVASVLVGSKAPSEDDFYKASGEPKTNDGAVDGVEPDLLRKALRKFHFHTEILEISQNQFIAIATLDKLLSEGRCVILCVDHFTHWSAVIGKLGNSYLVIDPANPDMLIRYTENKLVKRWGCVDQEAKKPHPPIYFGVVVWKMDKYYSMD